MISLTSTNRIAFTSLLALCLCSAGLAQDKSQDPDTELRLSRLEGQFEALATDLEDFQLADVFLPPGASHHGLGPAASKVYQRDQGLSIGGYGEAEYVNPDSGTASFDMHRAVFYFGYKFDEHWVFNSEIEIEHADEAFVEFAYVDYLHSAAASFRGGLMLVPMGLINEYHEPTTFLGASRPLTESYILPSTWREGGAAVYGELGGFDYHLALINGFDGSGFGGKTGLRGGRQKGSKALAEDLAVVGVLEWTDTPGLLVGGSVYSGDAGQSLPGGSMETTIVEAHIDYRSGPFWGRALVSDASVDDRADGDMDLSGWYAEAGWDLLSDDEHRALLPFVRFEQIDTDTSAGGIDDTVTTIGLYYRPIDSIVLKLDYGDYEDDMDSDRLMLTLGYVF